MGINTIPNKGLHGDDAVPDRILDSSMRISTIPTKGLHGDDTVPDNILDSGMGTGLAPSKGLRAEGSNLETYLDSSMGIGPTSHKSLAGNEAAALAAAPVSQRNMSGLGSAGRSPDPAQIGIFIDVHICLAWMCLWVTSWAHCLCFFLFASDSQMPQRTCQSDTLWQLLQLFDMEPTQKSRNVRWPENACCLDLCELDWFEIMLLRGYFDAVLGGNSFRESSVEKGMVLPFTPLAMSFSDVHYYVDVPAVRLLACSSQCLLVTSFLIPVSQSSTSQSVKWSVSTDMNLVLSSLNSPSSFELL